MASASITELTDSNFDQLIREKDVAVVDVYATWCGNCRLFAPAFEAVAGTHPDFSFFKLDGEKNPNFVSKVDMDNLPFVAVFHKGEYVGGQVTTKRDKLEEMVSVIKAKIS